MNRVERNATTILYDYPRYMSDTEVVKCGSFPRDYNFYGTSVVYSVGMSVPPLMIARIADDLMKQIDLILLYKPSAK
jgi:DNA (cytosine-5)-methyltransferase 1